MEPKENKTFESNYALIVVSYIIWVVGIAILLIDTPKDKNVKYQLAQGSMLSIIFSILNMIYPASIIFTPFYNLILLLGYIYILINVLPKIKEKHDYKIPVISDLTNSIFKNLIK